MSDLVSSDFNLQSISTEELSDHLAATIAMEGNLMVVGRRGSGKTEIANQQVAKANYDKLNTSLYFQYILSEDFIREFEDRISWSWVSIEQNLSEDFIREFQHKVNWHNISFAQKLSKEFIIEFIDKISFYDILINDNISQEIKDYCRMFT